MPTKRLPPAAHLDHLKHQAKDLLRDFRAGTPAAHQRLREFHPKLHGLPDSELAQKSLSLSDAQLAIAREYGYASWPRLKTVVAERTGVTPELIHNDRIEDGPFKRAVDFLDEGDVARLRAHLTAHPELVRARVQFEGDNYFTAPTLLSFVAENPVRQGRLPSKIVEVARVIVMAGCEPAALEETLELVASGRICREAGAQGPLLQLLCENGAAPNSALQSALAHGEFDAAERLLDLGATLDLPAAAALGRKAGLIAMLPEAAEDTLQLGLSLAALHGHAAIVTALISAGADPNRYNPQGAHSHCTPLHSAAFAGHSAAVRALVDGGAQDNIPDIHHGATARGWASHAGQAEIEAYLASVFQD